VTAQDFQEIWIYQGKRVARPAGAKGEALTERQLLQQREYIKVQTGPTGTTIKWVMFAANWTSLYYAMSWLQEFGGPITLCYFNSGWFEETVETASDARARIDALISKSDIRFSTKTFTRSFDPRSTRLPDKLRTAWSAGCILDEDAVVCAVDTDRHLTQVEHIGSKSALAQVWGISPVSYPCLSGHSYDRVVSESYYEVVKTGRPVYNHILAAMVHPGGEVHWFGYHRLVFPVTKRIGQLPQVTVACEVAKVDIPLL
jgi:hypothetical protein